MIVLPDTNVWIHFLNPGANPVKDRFLETDPATIRFCSVVKAELFFGAMKSNQAAKNLVLLDELFANFDSLPFDDAAARKYGEIRWNLSRKGTPIGPNDTMIAAIAVAHNAVLITNNTREFKRIDNLEIRDWES